MKSLLGLTLLVLGASIAGAQPDPGLAENSPFLPPNSAAAPTAEATPLELRGILTMGSKSSFNLYDPATKTSEWVGLNEQGQKFTVTNFDAGNDRVTVNYQGRVLTLTLQQPKIVAAPVVQGPPSQTPTPMPAAVLNPTSTDEARRMEAVAAEVRRRRALRLQAAAEASRPPGQPGANNGGRPPQPPARQ
ncbi:hypothetical protein K0B96_01020 [Horticoccus luteus]|uniref:Uncharacterized protein n=1 Tax=Horticoccus luteus TaxID=2862869 RepID=A0A8F9TVU1_9BACT|nr:hypothetical protein [Horticoccus luteus]QYM79228.1 hypothetical protein K0B96_01020 [Horticoccus luteus]